MLQIKPAGTGVHQGGASGEGDFGVQALQLGRALRSSGLKDLAIWNFLTGQMGEDHWEKRNTVTDRRGTMRGCSGQGLFPGGGTFPEK